MKQPKPSRTQDTSAREARCHCGHLVAKLREEGVELKCRRCKRIVILPFNTNGMEEHILKPCHST